MRALAHQVVGGGLSKVVLLHPLGSSKAFFTDVCSLVSSSLNVQLLAVDARGMGDSEMGAEETGEDWSWTDLASDVVKLADKVFGEHEQFAVVGVSMGGMLIQHMVKQYSHRVRSAVLCSTTSSTRGQEDMWKQRFAALQGHKTLPKDLVEATLGRWFTTPNGKGFERERQTLLACSSRGYIAHAKLISLHHIEKQEFQCPVLIVCGADDAGTNVAAHEKLSAQISQSKLVVVAGMAHALPSQSPELFASLIKDYIV